MLIAIVLAIKNLTQLDVFWMLRTGEWIWNNKAVPHTDILSYTFEGAAWLDVKWLYQVVISLFCRAGHPEFIMVLQMLINVLIVIAIYKTYTTLLQLSGTREKPAPSAGIILATYLYLFTSEYRMTGRPEMISHLMSLAFILFYLAARKNKASRMIYLIIPLQVIWANSHDAFVNGMIISAVFIAAELIEYRRLLKTGSAPALPRHLLAASVLSILSVAINPRGILLYAYPFRIYTSLNENNYTQEFFSCLDPRYWMGKEPYLLLIALFICLAGILFWGKGPFRENIREATRTFGSGYFIVLLLFFYLALSAERNLVFFMILSAPFIGVTLHRFSGRTALSGKPLPYLLFSVGGIVLYINICNNNYYRALHLPFSYGLSLNRDEQPAGAVKFIKEMGITGNCFSDYLSSSPLLWLNRPGFKSFIDLRDLEVFNPEFFTRYNRMLTDTSAFALEERNYHFDYAAVYPGDFSLLHRYLFHNKSWELVYLEPACAIYLKKNKRNAALLAALSTIPGAKRIHGSIPYEPSSAARAVSALFWPPYKINTRQGMTEKQLGDFYQKMAGITSAPAVNYKEAANRQIAQNQLKEAVLTLEEGLKHEADVDTYFMLSECAGAIHMQHPGETIYMKKWFIALNRALQLQPQNSRFRLMLGLAYCMDKKDCDSTKIYLEGLNEFPGMSDTEKALLKKCKSHCDISH